MTLPKRGRLTFKPNSLVEYTTSDKWAIEAYIGRDEVRNLEVIDLGTLDQWRPGDDPLGLTHAPDDRRDVTDSDLAEIEEVLASNFSARRRRLLLIRRDGSERIADLPPEPTLVVQDASPQTPRPKPRRPSLGFWGGPLTKRNAPVILGPGVLVVLGLVLRSFSRPLGISLALVGLLLCGVLITLGLALSRRLRNRKRRNLCVECGYSRRGIPDNEACPECGAGHWYE